MIRSLLIALMACLLAAMAPPTLGHPLHVVTEPSSFAYLENGRVAGAATAAVEATLRAAGQQDYQVDIYP